MTKKICCLLLFSCFCVYLQAQNYTISGYAEDAKTGEKLINANVFDANTFKGATSNNYGFYSLTLPKGKVKLTFSFVGYAPDQHEINLTSDTVIHSKLQPSIELDEVVITDSKSELKVKSSQMSVVEISSKTIKALPVFLGEVDVLKAIQLMPGVQSGTEGSSGIYVRGGGPDQNLMLLDGVPVYNASHLFGFFSVFNADAIQDVKLIKGGFPARYGGRLSSVLDIRLKEGDSKQFKGEGSVGIISSRLTIEGPIIKDKTSFIVSGRRTYIDLLARPFIKLYQKQNDLDDFNLGYYFGDLNAKINHKFSDRSRIFLSMYAGQDKFSMREKNTFDEGYSDTEFYLKWGNITTALRWNYMINNKLFSNTTITYSKYEFSLGEEMIEKFQNKKTDERLKYSSGIDDIAVNLDFDYFLNPSNNIKFGGSYINHTFNPGVFAYRGEDSVDVSEILSKTFGDKKIQASDIALYAEDDIKITNQLQANIGVRYSGFLVNSQYYHYLEPRLSARMLISDKWSVKAAYSQMNQYIHLLTNANLGLPTDLWLPATDKIKPQRSVQYAVGSVYAINKDIDISIEGFYKTMDNLIEYKEGASFFEFTENWQDKVEIGKGWSYGMEVLLQKNYGNTTGWIGYTMAWSERQFENISFGKRFPYKYDRRHDISVVVTHKFNDKIDVGATWVYGTGNATTLGIERYNSVFNNMTDNQFNYYGNNGIVYFDMRNNYRMPAYHRLDVSINFHKQKKWGQRVWSLGMYNAYNRKNPFFMMFDTEYEQKNGVYTEKKVLKQYSLFPIIPSISYSFKF